MFFDKSLEYYEVPKFQIK